MTDASQTLCSCCHRNPPLALTPFCAACLLIQGSADPFRAPTGAHRRHLAPVTVVASYEIIELLGEGGFAEVYSARPLRSDPAKGNSSPIALKIVKRGMDSREILARFHA